jgi:putative hemin transport protein
MTMKHRVLALTLALAFSGTALNSVQAGTSPLADRWAALRTEQPKLMIRDAAAKLGVSEAELLATTVGQTATRLQDDGTAASEIMRGALDLGTVLALTRNDNGVIERTGVATRLKPEDEKALDAEQIKERQARINKVAGGYLGGEIDLRFTFANWKYAFAVVQPGRDGKPSRSLQFFDASGTAVHKVYLKNDAGIPVFDKLVAQFRNPDQNAPLTITAAPAKVADKPDDKVDVKEFQQAWAEMTDVHQFNRLLTEFGMSREQAMRLAPAGMVERIAPEAVRTLLDESAKQQLDIMAFVGNRAVIQIYSGKVVKTAASGDWYNVLDPQFNLHLRTSTFKNGWVVRRAGITSVEFYDNNGELVVTFFGVRDRTKPQAQAWTDLTKQLPKAAS